MSGGEPGSRRAELLRLQLRLRELARQLYEDKRSLVIVFEGWDAAGKGGNIRRLTERLDPRGTHVYSIGVPEGDDAHRHYMWRFWRRLRPPEEKQIVIFDRSWYGRVLVERVERFARPSEWQRAYREINSFERHLADHGTSVVKFWLQITRAEQLRRFEARKTTAHKEWKLTEEDWRNRERWAEYEEAVQEMFLKTSTSTAPWTIVQADDKRAARLQTLATVVDVLENGSGLRAEEADSG